MRPTLLSVKMDAAGQGFIYMIGGSQERHNLCYNTKENIWKYLPRMPVGHNITCNVCVNYFDRAIFSFMVDGWFNLMAAVMSTGKLFDDPQQVDEDMQWVLKCKAEEHQINRFHIKSACTTPDGTILVTARGQLPGQKELIAFLILTFDVEFV